MTRSTVIVLFGLTFAGCNEPRPESEPSESKPSEDDMYRRQREELVEKGVEAEGVTDPAVLEAMRQVQRHLFVPDERQELAYENTPLSIGYEQTISQPFIVGKMTELLELEPGERVLEIGTGSGYQAAVLARLGCEVFTIEIVPELAEEARLRLKSLGYTGVHVRSGDGYQGWPEEAPFDGIILTAAPDHIPQPLIEQLRVGAHLVLPVGKTTRVQELRRLTRQADRIDEEVIFGVRFVPMTGEAMEDRGSTRR